MASKQAQRIDWSTEIVKRARALGDIVRAAGAHGVTKREVLERYDITGDQYYRTVMCARALGIVDVVGHGRGARLIAPKATGGAAS